MANRDDIAMTVSICCATYNHEQYIRDAIEGFIGQTVDFELEILLYDDASTDSTPYIITEYQKKYPALIKPILATENQYSKGVKTNHAFNLMRARGEFVALCEGDDYWIDPRKLQKQVDFMTEHPMCSMCFHRAMIESIGKPPMHTRYTPSHGSTRVLESNRLWYLGGSSAPTASMLYRRNLMLDLPPWFHDAPVGDMPTKLILQTKGPIGYIDEVMSVRRIGAPGSWNDQMKQDISQRYGYLEGMIEMLNAFNEYSGRQWSEAITERIVGYERRKNRLGLSSWVSLRKKYPEFVQSVARKQRILWLVHDMKQRLKAVLRRTLRRDR
jgi:glycosyltransferase involved in cell wall biosynthesis